MYGFDLESVEYPNDQHGNTLNTSERVTLYVPAGEHILSAKIAGNVRKDVEAVVKPGVTRYYRLTIHSSGVTDIDPTLPDAE